MVRNVDWSRAEVGYKISWNIIQSHRNPELIHVPLDEGG